MVLTNFECWAHGGNMGNHAFGDTAAAGDIVTAGNNRANVDLFNPHTVSQISSNGYYGFARITPQMEAQQQQHQNNQQDSNNNNGSITADANFQQESNTANNVLRCKKRHGIFPAGNDMESMNGSKRCRYDDVEDDMAAQYCNDFFSLPMVTQVVGTQLCLMDIEEEQAQQVNGVTAITNAQTPQLIIPALAQNAQQHSATPTTTTECHQQQQENLKEQQEQHLQQQQYHHQHYQGHLHRANRDVSRCMMSHMI